MESDEDTLSTIHEEVFDGYEFNPHPQVVEYDQLNGYHHISGPADDTFSVTNDEEIPAIFTDVVNHAWQYYKQHRKQHNTDCHTTTTARMVARTRMGTAIFPPPDAKFVEHTDMDV